MDFFLQILLLSFSAAIINNYTVVWFVGSCSFLGVTGRLDTATGMGLAVTFVMAVSGFIAWPIMEYVLKPGALATGVNLEVLGVVVYIIIIAAAVQVVEMYLRKFFPPLFRAFGIYLPLIVTNCAVLLACLQIQDHVIIKHHGIEHWSLIEGTTLAIMAGLGYTLAMVIMAGVREDLQMSRLPRFFRGPAIALIVAGVLAMAFMGFTGVDKNLQLLLLPPKPVHTVATTPVEPQAQHP